MDTTAIHFWSIKTTQNKHRSKVIFKKEEGFENLPLFLCCSEYLRCILFFQLAFAWI
jgi:hypothetical protein